MKLANSPGYKNARRIRAQNRILEWMKPIKEEIARRKEKISEIKETLKKKNSPTIVKNLEDAWKSLDWQNEADIKRLLSKEKELEVLHERIVTTDYARTIRTKKPAEGRKKPQRGIRNLRTH